MSIASITFNLFAIFIGIYSIITLFALLRYGKAKGITIIIALLYLSFLTAFYMHGLNLIDKLAA